MKRQERRGAKGESDLLETARSEEQRPESEQQPVAPREIRPTFAATPQDDELLLEQDVLRHHRSNTTGTTELRGDDGKIKQAEQDAPRLPVSVGQTSGVVQRCRTL